MTLFKKNRKQSETRIIRRDIAKVQDTTPRQAIVSTVLHQQRWHMRQDEFRGFDSPPGRF